MHESPVNLQVALRNRLARHWMAGLRSSAAIDAIDMAVNAGLLDRVERTKEVSFFRVGKKIARWTGQRVRTLVRSIFGRGNTRRDIDQLGSMDTGGLDEFSVMPDVEAWTGSSRGTGTRTTNGDVANAKRRRAADGARASGAKRSKAWIATAVNSASKLSASNTEERRPGEDKAAGVVEVDPAESSASPSAKADDGVAAGEAETKSAVAKTMPRPVRRADAQAAFDTTVASAAADGPIANARSRGPRRERLDRIALLRLIRHYATPPSATPVATLLLLADAVAQSEHDLDEVLAILRRPKPVVAVIGGVQGFEAAFVDLLRNGAVLPGRSSFLDGFDLQSSRDSHGQSGARRQIVVFRGERAERVDDADTVSRQVGRAAQHAWPVLAVADHADRIPEGLLEAADLRLIAGPVSPWLVAETMRVVLGRRGRGISIDSLTAVPIGGGTAVDGDGAGADINVEGGLTPAVDPVPETLADGAVMAGLDAMMHAANHGTASPAQAGAATPPTSDPTSPLEGCEVLTLADLALAIRPGMKPRRCVELLRGLIAKRRRKAASSHSAARPREPASRSTSASSSRRDRIGSGSTIILPDVVPSHRSVSGLDAIRTPPFVETLSGYGAAREWALGLRDDLALWKDGKLGWSEMSTRLLLAGPPGTGKTMFAKALGNTLEIPLLATSVGTWLEPSHLGDVLARMAAAFAEAEKHAPCILFVDEIDGIGKRGRSREYDDYWTSVVNKALEILDGAVKSEGIVVLGATNHAEAIDPALLRSGRLEMRIDVPMPDVDALTGILRHHLGKDSAGVISTATAADPGGAGAMQGDVPNTGDGEGNTAGPSKPWRTVSAAMQTPLLGIARKLLDRLREQWLAICSPMSRLLGPSRSMRPANTAAVETGVPSKSGSPPPDSAGASAAPAAHASAEAAATVARMPALATVAGIGPRSHMMGKPDDR